MRTKLVISVVVLCTSACAIAVLIPRHTRSHSGSVVLIADPEVVTIHASGAEDDSQEYTVRIKNVSSSPVPLATVETSCSCTVVREGIPKELGPHTEFDLRLKVSAPQYGEQSSSIVLRSQSPIFSPLTIPVKMIGKVRPVPFVVYCPLELQMTIDSQKRKKSMSFEIVTHESEGSAAWLTGVNADDPAWAAQIAAPVSSKVAGRIVQRVYSVTAAVELAEPGLTGKVSTLLKLVERQTSELPLARIHITGTIEDAISIFPARVVFSKSQLRNERIRRRVTLRGVGDRDWKVTAARCKSSAVLVSFEAVGSTAAVVNLEIDPQSLENNNGEIGTVEIATTHPDRPRIAVTISVLSD